MQGVHKPIARNSTTNRSAVTNGSKLLVGIDGRSPTARRFRDLVQAYKAEIGGDLSEPEMAMIKTAASLSLTAELMQADNREWRGRRVRHGAVVYIAAEGGLGIEERLTAYRLHHGVEAAGVPLYVIPEPIDLCKSDADVTLLTKRLGDLPKEPAIELIVVDTLSRALAGGNENGADDMGAFVRHCDRLRAECRAHVMIIHHAGKDEGRGARGHSLLRAATDTEIEVTKSEVSRIATAESPSNRCGPTRRKYEIANAARPIAAWAR